MLGLSGCVSEEQCEQWCQENDESWHCYMAYADMDAQVGDHKFSCYAYDDYNEYLMVIELEKEDNPLTHYEVVE